MAKTDKYGRATTDFDISKDEINTLKDAFQKPEFAKLFGEYVKEVTDPENVAKYESDIIQLEEERGVHVTFIHPTPGYVIKSSVDGFKKAFINVCTNENVEQPSYLRKIVDGKEGYDWRLPYMQAPPREEMDKQNQRVVAYDVIFHPLTLKLASKNKEMRQLVNDIAISAVEDTYQVTLDRKNMRFPKVDYKGMKRATVVRRKIEKKQGEPEASCSSAESTPVDVPYPPMPSDEVIPEVTTPRSSQEPKNVGYTKPKYIMKQRKGLDMFEYTYEPDAKMDAVIPSELVVEIDLPLIRGADEMDLDITEKKLMLKSEKVARYKLDIMFPYTVDEDGGNAKFDKATKKLIVTLPVKKKMCRESVGQDSGIESDPRRSSSEEDVSSETPPLVEVVSERPEPTTPELRAQEEPEAPFLKDGLYYTLPKHNIQQAGPSELQLTIQQANVEPNSITHRFISNRAIQIKFLSIGGGHFKSYFALCLSLPFDIDATGVSCEAWDNNVVVQIPVLATETYILTEYLIGEDENHLYSQTLPSSFTLIPPAKLEPHIPEVITETVPPPPSEPIKSTSSTKNKLVPRSISPQSEVPSVPSPRKARTLSESSNKENAGRRSILKMTRSLSESHTEDYSSQWSSVESDSIGPDELNQNVKKHVTFSDIILKKVFRSNSTILGQRKKTQRHKMKKNKYDEQGPSASESEQEHSEADTSGCEASSVSSSEVESSESEVEGAGPAQEVCVPSSKKHRRHGKKSHRKAAAAAKHSAAFADDD